MTAGDSHAALLEAVAFVRESYCEHAYAPDGGARGHNWSDCACDDCDAYRRAERIRNIDFPALFDAALKQARLLEADRFKSFMYAQFYYRADHKYSGAQIGNWVDAAIAAPRGGEEEQRAREESPDLTAAFMAGMEKGRDEQRKADAEIARSELWGDANDLKKNNHWALRQVFAEDVRAAILRGEKEKSMLRSEMSEKLIEIENAARKAVRMIPCKITSKTACEDYEVVFMVRRLLEHVRELCDDVLRRT